MDNQKDVIMKKEGKGAIIVIGLLFLVILGLSLYICYDKGIFKTKETDISDTSKKEKTNTKNEKKSEGVTFSDSELEKYVNYISPVSIGPSALIYDKDVVYADSLSAGDKVKYIGSYVYSKHTTSPDYQYDIISEIDVKSSVEEVYGLNSYEKTTFNLGCGNYTINENENKYYSQTGCGGTTATIVSNLITDYKATKNKLEITTAYAFFDGMTNKIYKDYNKNTVLDEYESNNITEAEAYLKEYVKKNKDRLNTIVYTFNSSDGKNYYFNRRSRL